MMSEDKRKYLRFECLVPVELFEVQGEPAPGLKGNIGNVSREGIGLIFNLGLDFAPGTAIGFKMYNKEIKKECHIQGEVAWSRLSGSKIEVGVRIANIEKSTKADLLEMGFNTWRDKMRITTHKQKS